MQQGVANNECRLAKFNKYPKYKSQLLAKTCPRHSTTSWNKERWIKLKEQAKQHSMHLFLIFSPKNLQDQQESRFLIFSTIFLYFSPNRCNTSSNHKNLHLKQRWDVVYRNSGAFLKNWKITWKPQNSFFLNFFEFFEIGSKRRCRFIVCTEFCFLSAVKN